MDFKINPDDVAALASKAIFDTLDQAARDSILQQAVASLLTPEKNGYGRAGKTPLETAFENGISAAAHQVVREHLLDDPAVAEGIRKLLGPMLEAAMSAEAEHYDTTLADAIGTALGSWLADKAREGRA